MLSVPDCFDWLDIGKSVNNKGENAMKEEKCLLCASINYISWWSPYCAKCLIEREERSLYRNGWPA